MGCRVVAQMPRCWHRGTLAGGRAGGRAGWLAGWLAGCCRAAGQEAPSLSSADQHLAPLHVHVPQIAGTCVRGLVSLGVRAFQVSSRAASHLLKPAMETNFNVVESEELDVSNPTGERREGRLQRIAAGWLRWLCWR